MWWPTEPSTHSSCDVRVRQPRQRVGRRPPKEGCLLAGGSTLCRSCTKQLLGISGGHQPQYPPALPDLLTAIAELLSGRQCSNAALSDDNSANHTRGVPRIGCPRVRACNPPMPAAWVETFGRRLSLWEEQQLFLPQHPDLLPVPPTVLTDSTHLTAETHVQACSIQGELHGQSSRSICLALLNRLVGLLEYCGKTWIATPAAHCPILCERWQLFPLLPPSPHFIFDCVVPSQRTLGSVPGTFHHDICFLFVSEKNSPARARCHLPMTIEHPSFRFRTNRRKA